MNGPEKITRKLPVSNYRSNYCSTYSNYTVPHEMIKQQVVNRWTEASELCAWIHYTLSRPGVSRKLKEKLERFMRKKGFSSPNHRLPGYRHSASGRARLVHYPKYLPLDKLNLQRRWTSSCQDVLWPDQNGCSSCVKSSAKISKSFKYLYTPREVFKFWALWQKNVAFVTPQTSLFITLVKK